ncbi:ESX secretion-associated protein EspG [Nocardia mexicana]|uniref:ESAT-6 protein secretion system EspG family protein n=1 Tax=Nocardia mexicana TaxID=279262 RepID=A0A370HB92_9NOCA|nr:ESX secretion-associated protein EspG [Nocardia mexicana]RDI54206.1 ESAT-6 protein secretion system EspG family protein [Nocardia mexicana]
MAEWSWDPDDFAVLWYSDANDRFPHPLHYTSRLASNDEVAAHRNAVRARYDADETERITLALHTLTSCDLRIEIGGESTVLGKGKPREYRILGARTPYHAVMLTQTAADGVDGPIRCRLFRPEQLPARLAAILPSVPPGSGKPDTFHVDELRSRDDGYSSRNSPRERFDRLTQRPFDGSGAAGLLAGYLHSRPDPWYAMGWFDVTGDGRYVQQQTREHITVRPATTQDLTSHFETWIERSLQRLREDEPATW